MTRLTRLLLTGVFNAALLLGSAHLTHAASHTWSGAVNGNFSTAGNWTSGIAPNPAVTNTLTFPAGATRFTITNDIASLKISAINLSGSGYVIRGANAITLTFSLLNILASGTTNTVECPLTFASSGSASVGDNDSLTLSGILSGVDGFTKFGNGDLFIKGAASNPLSGDLDIFAGEIYFQKTGGAANYTGNHINLGGTDVGNLVRLHLGDNNQIPDGATISFNPSGVLALNGFTDIVGPVSMHGGIINGLTGGSLLRIDGDLTLTPRVVGTNEFGQLTYESPTVWGAIEFNGASRNIHATTNVARIEAHIVETGSATVLNKTGPGTLTLMVSNSFTGQLNVQQGTLVAEDFHSLGTASSNTVVSSGASLKIPAAGTLTEPLILGGAGDQGTGALILDAGGNTTCSGLITLTSQARVFVPPGQQLQFSGVVAGAGGIEKTGLGELALSGVSANTFSGASFVNAGRMQLSKPPNTKAIASVTVTNGASLVFNNNEQMDNAGVLSIYGNASVNLTNRNETISGLNLGGNHTLDTGTGMLTLLGNVYSGPPYSTNAYPYAATIRGNLSLGGATRTLQTSNTALVLDCFISDGAGVGGFDFPSGGTLSLLRSNSFTGPASISGQCYVSNNFAFGAPGGGVHTTNTNSITVITFLQPTDITGETLHLGNYLWFNTASSSYSWLNSWNGPVITQTNAIFEFAGGNSTLTVNGHISGPGVVQGYSGLMRLTASNSYSGMTYVEGGSSIAVQNPNALGATAQGTRVYEGGTLVLELPNGGVVTNEALHFWSQFSSGSSSNLVDWLALSGPVSNTWRGPVTLDYAPTRISVLHSNGTLVLDSTITGNGGFYAAGPGTVVLAGNNPNSNLGRTAVEEGTLILNKPNGVQAVSRLAVTNFGKVVWNASEQIPDHTTLSLQSWGFGFGNALLGSHSETVSNLAMIQSFIIADTGTFTLLGDVDVFTPSFSLENYCGMTGGSLVLSAGTHRILPVTPSFWQPSYFFASCQIRESGGSAGLHIKSAYGMFSESNAFTGQIVVERGGLNAFHPYAFGSAAQGVLVTNQSFVGLTITNNIAMPGEAIVLAAWSPGDLSANRLYLSGDATNSWGGSLTLIGSNEVDVAYGSKYTLTGPVFGPGSLHTTGNGELVLAGAQPNTFNGLNFAEGTVRLAKSPGVPALTGDVIMAPDGFEFVSPTLILDAPNQFPPQTAISVGTLANNALFNLNGHAATVSGITGLGDLEIGTGTLTINGSAESSFYGRTTGMPGGTRLIKLGSGTQYFWGESLINGDVLLQGGNLGLGDSAIGQLDIAAGTVLSHYGETSHFGSLAGAGQLYTLPNGVIFVGANNANTLFAGTIFGGSNTNLIKVGTGALTLSGNSTDPGKTVVKNGTLVVNGALRGPVHVQPGGAGQAPTLGGIGILGNVVATGLGARVSPGAATTIPSYGKLTVTNIAFDSGAIYACQLGGTNAGVNLDQIDAKGTFTITGGTADFTAFGAGTVSNRYAVVKSFAAVSGTFSGDPEGDIVFPAAGRVMAITYLTAAGKEITLIEQPGANLGNLNIGGISQGKNGNMTISGTGVSGAIYNIQANTNLNTTNWIVIGTATGDFNGMLSFTDTNAVYHPMRFYRFMLP